MSPRPLNYERKGDPLEADDDSAVAALLLAGSVILIQGSLIFRADWLGCLGCILVPMAFGRNAAAWVFVRNATRARVDRWGWAAIACVVTATAGSIAVPFVIWKYLPRPWVGP